MKLITTLIACLVLATTSNAVELKLEKQDDGEQVLRTWSDPDTGEQMEEILFKGKAAVRVRVINRGRVAAPAAARVNVNVNAVAHVPVAARVNFNAGAHYNVGARFNAGYGYSTGYALRQRVYSVGYAYPYVPTLNLAANYGASYGASYGAASYAAAPCLPAAQVQLVPQQVAPQMNAPVMPRAADGPGGSGISITNTNTATAPGDTQLTGEIRALREEFAQFRALMGRAVPKQ